MVYPLHFKNYTKHHCHILVCLYLFWADKVFHIIIAYIASRCNISGVNGMG